MEFKHECYLLWQGRLSQTFANKPEILGILVSLVEPSLIIKVVQEESESASGSVTPEAQTGGVREMRRCHAGGFEDGKDRG